MFRGAIEITLGRDEEAIAVRVESQELFSVPPGAWRSIASVGDEPAEIAMLIAGDERKLVKWDTAVAAQATQAGFGVDHNGYVALRHLLPEAQLLAAE